MIRLRDIQRIVLAIALTTVVLCASAQTHNRQRNTIYVLDCTGSMGGYNGAPDIWAPTKTFLKAELEKEAKENSNSRVTILPFQDKVLQPIQVNLKSMNWSKLENTLDEYLKKLTATNICDSWLEAEKHIDQTCDNYIVLMTDGHDNIGGSQNETNRTEKLAQILNTFCGKYQNTRGFYVELTQVANLPANIQTAINLCNCLYKIDATQGIPSFGCLSEDVIHVNTRDLPTDITFGFSNSGLFAASLVNSDNPFVEMSIKNGKISQGNFTIHIESKFGDDVERLNQTIASSSTTLSTTVQSHDVTITNPDLEIELHTAPLRSLNLSAIENSTCSSAIERVHPFLWVEGNPADTLQWNLKPEFNTEAACNQSSALFRIKSNQNLSNITLLYNREVVTDSIILICPGKEAIIEAIIPASESDNTIELTLSEISSENLDRINEVRPESYTFALNGTYDTYKSTAEIIILVLLVLIILILFLWFTLIQKRLYPRFKEGIITIKNPYYATLRVKNNRLIVLTPTHKQQGWLDKLWKGKILYHINAEWPCDVEISPKGKNMRFRCPSGVLISDPSPIWSRGMEVNIQSSNDSSFKIDININ